MCDEYPVLCREGCREKVPRRLVSSKNIPEHSTNCVVDKGQLIYN